jgi:ribosomal protein S18 acetylase RimI-like enzyme
VQLALSPKQNAKHRGEVQKLMVHSQFRRRGIAKALMASLEATARQRGIHLLVLDTREGDAAERLYATLEYTRVGVIPGFALSTSGNYDPTVIFYRHLPAV